MTKAEFLVGMNEQHSISVDASPILDKKLKISVDGRELLNTVWSGHQNEGARFSVGDKEQHHVEIRVRSGLWAPKITLLVDGEVSGTS